MADGIFKKNSLYSSGVWAVLIASFIFLRGGIGARAQESKLPVYIGYSFTIHSNVLQEDRDILLYLPSGYDKEDAKFPVMYLLDGLDHFHHVSGLVSFLAWAGRMPEMIVVGIPNTDRQRDLTPPIGGARDSLDSGRADNFQAFIGDELIPYIDKNYKTRNYRILVGHSAGGNFAIYSLITKPELFDAYVAISPALDWADNKLAKDAEKFFGSHRNINKFLYLSMGQEGDMMVKPIEKFANMLVVNAPDSLQWKYSFMRSENHLSTPHKSIYETLELLYRDWRLTDEIMKKGLGAILDHYQRLSVRFGYDIKPSEKTLNTAGYVALGDSKYDEAIRIFAYNIELYPNSANVYDSMGDAYEKSGQDELALKNYTLAVDKSLANMDPNLKTYRANLKRVQAKLAK